MTGTDVEPMTLSVTRKTKAADDIFMFELKAADGAELPAFSPGSHITVKAPSGQMRRYSLCNSPAERDRYVIAVKNEASGRGGSRSMAERLREGDTLEVQPPENEFEMSAGKSSGTVFIAGGIGITPIRSMILHLLAKGDRNFKLYYLTRSAETTAFLDELKDAGLADNVIVHHDNGNPDDAYDLWPVLEEQRGAHLYCCGPRGLMDAVRDMSGHWSDGAVHFEDFVGATANYATDTPFDVKLAKSGDSYTVPAGSSILDILRQHGHTVPSSCESGTCGTCKTRVLEGEADHRDFVLTDQEKARHMMICVSRARSPSLTLDL